MNDLSLVVVDRGFNPLALIVAPNSRRGVGSKDFKKVLLGFGTQVLVLVVINVVVLVKPVNPEAIDRFDLILPRRECFKEALLDHGKLFDNLVPVDGCEANIS